MHAPGRKNSVLPRPAFELGVRLAISFALVAAVVVSCRGPILRILLPLIFYEVNWLGDEISVNGIGVRGMEGDHFIYLDGALTRPVTAHGKVLFPGEITATGGTLSGYIFQTIILFWGVLAGWPAARWHLYLLRALLGGPLLVLLLAIDVPLVMLATLWRGVLHELGTAPFSALLLWDRFLSYGGRLALALGIAAVTILAVERVFQRYARAPAPMPAT